MDRRRHLVARATDYVLEHGLIGLSLRPLASALGTSDRMLLYHLGSKDTLIAEIIRESTARSVAELEELPGSRSPREAVYDQWRLRSGASQLRCERLYVEASALGLFGSEPYATEVMAGNQQWMRAVAGHLSRSGVPADNVVRVSALVEATFMGLELDMPLGDVEVRVGLDALAEAVDLLSR